MDENLEIIVGEQKVFHGVGREKLTIDQHLAKEWNKDIGKPMCCLLYTSPSPRDS